jgi:hypothetical protein
LIGVHDPHLLGEVATRGADGSDGLLRGLHKKKLSWIAGFMTERMNMLFPNIWVHRVIGISMRYIISNIVYLDQS